MRCPRKSGSDNCYSCVARSNHPIFDVKLCRHYPLNAIRPGKQDWAEVVNSPLSEAATLGFEYGFSLGSRVRHVCVAALQ